MNVKEELHLFNRYAGIYKEEGTQLVCIASIHLAQQLDRYINPTLDLGWVIRCILDINSQSLFSNARVPCDQMVEVADNSIHPEYKYAQFIIRLSQLFIKVNASEHLEEAQLADYVLSKDSQFYFGECLTELNQGLVDLLTEKLKISQ